MIGVVSRNLSEDDDVLVLSETALVLVIESRMLWQGDEFDYEHRDAEHEHEHDEILLLVAFSCALRRDKLDGRELVGSWQLAVGSESMLSTSTISLSTSTMERQNARYRKLQTRGSARTVF